MVEPSLDSSFYNKLLDLYAAGNPYVVGGLFVIGFFYLYKYLEQPLKSLGALIKKLIFNMFGIARENKEDSFKARGDLFFDKMFVLVSKIRDLRLSGDLYRNKLYHYLMYNFFTILLRNFQSVYNKVLTGEISPRDFACYNKNQAVVLEESVNQFCKELASLLKDEGWSDELIEYLCEAFRSWLSPSLNLLKDFINEDQFPLEVLKSWWIFIYEIYNDLSKFKCNINGHIIGLTFQGGVIGAEKKSTRS